MGAPISTSVPYQTPIADGDGLIQRVWSFFFRNLQLALDPLGLEKCFTIVNNNSVAADVESLVFDFAKVGQASVDYLIQRVTTGGGAQEKIETGTLYLAYKPTSNTWVLSGGPTTAGVTLTVTSSGQVQYTSSNLTGTAYISKFTFRARTLAAKNSSYSVMGG